MISNFSGHSELQNEHSLILEKRRSLMQQICHSEKYHTKIGLSQIIHPFSCVSSSGNAKVTHSAFNPTPVGGGRFPPPLPNNGNYS